ncbi:MAG: phosphate/phosphite/phosphonate ABC transporter substrate-binding protein [Bacteroidales bacterium]|nr:phosphate/phosphite/phosphonate ABC transporter substrate-binding protein [Bacteroidales bacterium]
MQNHTGDLDSNGYPRVFKIGVSTSEEDIQEVFRQREPIRLYLERKLGVPVKYYRVNGYAPIIEALRAKKIHFGTMSPFPYLIARKKANVSAIIFLGNPDGTSSGLYKSCILTRKSSGLTNLEDIKKRISTLTLAFVDPASTSGHIIPHNYFLSQGINPDKDFKKVIFASNQIAGVLTLYAGKVDVACVQTTIVEAIHKLNPKASPNDFNYIWVSEAIPPSAYCIRNDISPEFRQNVINAYMDMKKDSAAWRAVKVQREKHYAGNLPLDSLSFVPVREEVYEPFATMVSKLKDLEIK